MQSGRTVVQAERAKLEATQNIECKLNILEVWLEHGVPVVCAPSGHVLLGPDNLPLLEYFPTNRRQFKLWTASQNTAALRAQLPKIRSTSNDTLAARPLLENRAVELMAALERKCQKRRKDGTTTEMADLRETLRHTKLLLAERMTEVRKQRVENLGLKRENERLRSQQERNAAESDDLMTRLRTKVERLQRENECLKRDVRLQKSWTST